MQTRLNRQPRIDCQYAQLPIETLSDEQLLIRKRKTRQMFAVVVMLMLLIVAMAFLTDQYFMLACTAAMIPALDEYDKKAKAITRELRKRNLR